MKKLVPINLASATANAVGSPLLFHKVERAAGRVPKLAPQATCYFTIDVAILSEREWVVAAEQRVKKIKGKPNLRFFPPPSISQLSRLFITSS